MQEFPFLLSFHVVPIYHWGGLQLVQKKGHDRTYSTPITTQSTRQSGDLEYKSYLLFFVCLAPKWTWIHYCEVKELLSVVLLLQY